MLKLLNVKMLILNDGQEVIHHNDNINELITYWYHIRSSLLYK